MISLTIRDSKEGRIFVADGLESEVRTVRMDQLDAKIVMLSRQEMTSLSQALDMTAAMIEGSFDEDTEPASPHVLRAVALRGAAPNCPGSDPTIPATIWLSLHDVAMRSSNATAPKTNHNALR